MLNVNINKRWISWEDQNLFRLLLDMTNWYEEYRNKYLACNEWDDFLPINK